MNKIYNNTNMNSLESSINSISEHFSVEEQHFIEDLMSKIANREGKIPGGEWYVEKEGEDIILLIRKGINGGRYTYRLFRSKIRELDRERVARENVDLAKVSSISEYMRELVEIHIKYLSSEKKTDAKNAFEDNIELKASARYRIDLGKETGVED